MMARKVNQMPGHRRRSQYPWDEWFDRDIWELTHHEDFRMEPNVFAAYARKVAGLRRIPVTVRVARDKVYICAKPEDTS